MNKNILIIISVVTIVAVAGAILMFSGGGATSKVDTNFHTPQVVKSFDGEGGDTPINFKTNMSLDDVLSFYREKYSNLTERELLTVQSETTLNLVFDGHESGKALVIQAVSLPDGMTNINIRLEEI